MSALPGLLLPLPPPVPPPKAKAAPGVPERACCVSLEQLLALSEPQVPYQCSEGLGQGRGLLPAESSCVLGPDLLPSPEPSAAGMTGGPSCILKHRLPLLLLPFLWVISAVTRQKSQPPHHCITGPGPTQAPAASDITPSHLAALPPTISPLPPLQRAPGKVGPPCASNPSPLPSWPFASAVSSPSLSLLSLRNSYASFEAQTYLFGEAFSRHN